MPPHPIDFRGGGAFYAELRAGVRDLLAEPGRLRRGQRAMYLKSAVMLTWAAGSWALLVFAAATWWQAAALAVSLGFAMAGVAFNIVHDANHGSYSDNRRLNRAMQWVLDVIGASSHVWRLKHNVVHHTFTNVSGADADIEQMPFFRCTPDQPRRWFHRFQHVYAWPLYGIMAVRWQLVGDFNELRRGHVEGTPLAWPRGRDLVGFWLGKAAFLGWAVVIPLLVHPLWQVAAGFMAASFIFALTLAVVFQLAHNIEEAEVTDVESLSAAGSVEWARHQVETTVDFAPRSRLLRWYLGGLNFQVEHHLFSKVCHVHYPDIARLVRAACDTHGVRYRANDTMWQALVSHTRWLRRMGQREVLPQASAGSVAGGSTAAA